MAKKSLEDQRHELIKAHILDPTNTPLSPTDAETLDRVMDMARLLDRYPIEKDAVAIHMHKYKSIKRTAAYQDARMAKRIYNQLNNFQYDFTFSWLINDIMRNIDRWRKNSDPAAGRVIAMEHANMIKALGDRPVKDIDPKLMEAHQFVIPIQINNNSYNFDLEKLLDLPDGMRKKISDALVAEISDDEAKNIMQS